MFSCKSEPLWKKQVSQQHKGSGDVKCHHSKWNRKLTAINVGLFTVDDLAVNANPTKKSCLESHVAHHDEKTGILVLYLLK